jgi:succinate dehydrogenase / fumarate reductase flavoprotein subunit
MWEYVGMARNAEGLGKALTRIPEIRAAFWKDVMVPGSADGFNPALEKAGRVADFLEFAEILARDALMRDESCGGHFREEHHTPDGEAKRDDENFSFSGVWEYKGPDQEPALHKEPLTFEHVKPTQRSYK